MPRWRGKCLGGEKTCRKGETTLDSERKTIYFFIKKVYNINGKIGAFVITINFNVGAFVITINFNVAQKKGERFYDEKTLLYNDGNCLYVG